MSKEGKKFVITSKLGPGELSPALKEERWVHIVFHYYFSHYIEERTITSNVSSRRRLLLKIEEARQ